MLQYKRHPHIVTRRGLPFGGEVKSGMIVQHTFWDVAAFCVEGDATKVTCSKVLCSDLRGDLFIVNGFNENVIAEVSLTDPDIAGEGDGNDGDGNDSAEVDWDNGVLPSVRKDVKRNSGGSGAKVAQAGEVSRNMAHQVQTFNVYSVE